MSELFRSMLFQGSGLQNLMSTAINGWIGPVFLIIVAGVSITFLMRREIRQLIIFLIIAAIVGLLVYGGSSLFGSGGKLTNAASQVAGGVNTLVGPTVHSTFTNVSSLFHF